MGTDSARATTSTVITRDSLRRLASPQRRSSAAAVVTAAPSAAMAGGSRGQKPAWTANTKHRKSSHEFGHSEIPLSARRKHAVGSKKVDGDQLVARLHGLHQQRNERLEALRVEVERQRREKEKAECRPVYQSRGNGNRGKVGSTAEEGQQRVEDRLFAAAQESTRKKAEAVANQEQILLSGETGCTFSPATNYSSRRKKGSASDGGGARGVAMRSHAWEVQRKEKLAKLARAREESMEVLLQPLSLFHCTYSACHSAG